MAKSKQPKKASTSNIVFVGVAFVLLVLSCVGLFLTFLTKDLGKYLDPINIGLFDFADGDGSKPLGVCCILFAIITLILMIATFVLTCLKFTKVKINGLFEKLVCIITALFAVITLVLILGFRTDISKIFTEAKLEGYLLGVGAYLFTIPAILQGVVCVFNK